VNPCLADAGDVDSVTGAEQVGAEHLTDLEGGQVVYPELGEVTLSGCAGLLQVTELGFDTRLGFVSPNESCTAE